MPKETNDNRTQLTPNAKIAIAVVAGLILLFGAFAVGAMAGRFSTDARDERGIAHMDSPMRAGRMHRIGGLLNTDSRLVGVVTSVNGGKFTIASNGSTNEVTTSSSTHYRGGDAVKINDTVLVLGSTSSNVFTASEIDINP